MSVVGVLTEEVLVETVVDDEGGGGFSGHFPAIRISERDTFRFFEFECCTGA